MLGSYYKGDEAGPAWLATEHLPDGLQKTEIWGKRLKSNDLSLLETDTQPITVESVSYSFCKHILQFQFVLGPVLLNRVRSGQAPPHRQIIPKYG